MSMTCYSAANVIALHSKPSQEGEFLKVAWKRPYGRINFVITLLLTTTEDTDICADVKNSLVEKEIDLKTIVSVTTDGVPNIVHFKQKKGI
ncbi:hypothetical protein TNCV_3652751 [Trichonephila clavipes]|nr:hypothetical protein TNCV_3652751 [Trichonephila clavipes]